MKQARRAWSGWQRRTSRGAPLNSHMNKEEMGPEEAKRTVIQRLLERLGGRHPVCELCGGTRWNAGGFVNLSATQKLQGGIVLGGEIHPTMTLICTICGNQKFLNLIQLGLVQQRTKQGEAGDRLIREALGDEPR